MTPCKGDRSQACGGGWRVLIYNNTKYTCTFNEYSKNLTNLAALFSKLQLNKFESKSI